MNTLTHTHTHVNTVIENHKTACSITLLNKLPSIYNISTVCLSFMNLHLNVQIRTIMKPSFYGKALLLLYICLPNFSILSHSIVQSYSSLCCNSLTKVCPYSYYKRSLGDYSYHYEGNLSFGSFLYHAVGHMSKQWLCPSPSVQVIDSAQLILTRFRPWKSSVVSHQLTVAFCFSIWKLCSSFLFISLALFCLYILCLAFIVPLQSTVLGSFLHLACMVVLPITSLLISPSLFCCHSF